MFFGNFETGQSTFFQRKYMFSRDENETQFTGDKIKVEIFFHISDKEFDKGI